jgi:hypothetical protein
VSARFHAIIRLVASGIAALCRKIELGRVPHAEATSQSKAREILAREAAIHGNGYVDRERRRGTPG